MRGKLGKGERCLVLFCGNKVNEGEFKGPGQTGDPIDAPGGFAENAGSPSLRARIFHEKWGLAAVPLAVAVALVVHWFAAKQEPPGETELYTYFLGRLAGCFGYRFCASVALARLARSDRGSVPYYDSCSLVPGRLGAGDLRIPVASCALFPKPRRCFAKHGDGSGPAF